MCVCVCVSMYVQLYVCVSMYVQLAARGPRILGCLRNQMFCTKLNLRVAPMSHSVLYYSISHIYTDIYLFIYYVLYSSLNAVQALRRYWSHTMNMHYVVITSRAPCRLRNVARRRGVAQWSLATCAVVACRLTISSIRNTHTHTVV